MASNFSSFTMGVIGPRKDDMEKKVYKYQDFLREIERDLDYGKIKDKNEAMARIRNKFSYHLTSNDYRAIEKELGYIIK